MSRPPTENAWLRLETPFYLETALLANGFESGGLAAGAFADDAVAARLTAALRASLVRHAQVTNQAYD
jgi:hypothetical protein